LRRRWPSPGRSSRNCRRPWRSRRRRVTKKRPGRKIRRQMKVSVHTTPIPDLLIVEHELFQDDRGFFMEVYRQDVFREAGLPDTFVQMNHSRSARGVARGLHFQWDPPMGELMRGTAGAAFLVAVDIRQGPPTLGGRHGVEVTAESKRQIWAPAGFARGFYVLSEPAEIQYLCTGTYNPAGESGILWND